MPCDVCGCVNRRRTVGDLVSDPAHAGDVREAPLRGQAARAGRLVVWLGMWPGAQGAATRARFKATSCASLLAFAELTCELLEEGTLPEAIDAALLLGRLEGVHPLHRDRADLVVEALRAAIRTPSTLAPGAAR